MITETEIINILSGSLLGDYPAVIDTGTETEIAIDLFKKILDIDNSGNIQSSLFAITNASQNPDVISEYQLDLIDDAEERLNNLIKVVIPTNVQKLEFILDPDSIPGLTEQKRNFLLQERNRLSNLINSVAKVPIIFSEFITD